ncbi:uncharacterized protein TRIADDRAFT_60435 [Trichoplax adhaerens]|uniref:EF-hand domain-containing protein n=1 Tax=Trichoplax adhaerens TaxID=10228 RepID=B3S874_TRIAD|nr:hypothetical protein TRIADDRAFT_60435 [Trichoplax adhaerens]EDV21053.1 hypothetical protein TRIADDRAFT_60435 [Trichoplax adhaerens]|eukprot:XP_002116383.1 hypothetical protein TRIADDRAFT_60435 [Trichoplax adhaerens]
MLTNTGRFNDRSPGIRPAGILVAAGDTIQDCIPKDNRPTTPEKIKTFRQAILPEIGKSRTNRTKLDLVQRAEKMNHGIHTSSSESAAGLVNPYPQPIVQQILQFRKEDQTYLSRKTAPLGHTTRMKPGMPSDLDPDSTTFGIKVVKDEYASDAVNPKKSPKEVQEESLQNHDIYLRSHEAYEPGEQKKRNYTYESYNINKCYGVPTPHSNAGIHVGKALHWITDNNKGTKIVPSRVEDFHEKFQPQLGKVHDPISDSMKVPEDHKFGVIVKQDECDAGDLLHGRGPKDYLRGKDRLRGVVAAIRRQLKVSNYYNFESLKSAFNFYDKDGSGSIDNDEMREICMKFNLPIERELMEELIYYCDANNDGVIDYNEFANFLNWQDNDVPAVSARTAIIDSKAKNSASPENVFKLQKQIDKSVVDMRLSSQAINAAVGTVPTTDWRKYGVPTIRSDLPAPRVRRVADTQNYGDESDAYGLICPSNFSTIGVFENDFLVPRSPDELRDIFANIGYKLSDEEFQYILNQASAMNSNGNVSVDSFNKCLREYLKMNSSR